MPVPNTSSSSSVPTPSDLPSEIVDAVQAYKTNRFDAATAARLLPEVRSLTLRAMPVSRNDAQTFLSCLTRYLVWASVGRPDASFAELLTEADVARWLSAIRTDTPGRSHHTYESALRRALRVMAGLPRGRPVEPSVTAAVQSSDRPAAAASFDVSRLLCLVTSSGADAVLRGFVTSFGAGQVKNPGGARIAVDDADPALVWDDGRRRHVLEQFRGLAEQIEGQVVEPGDWKALKRFARRHQIAVSADLAFGWFLAAAVTVDRPLAEIIRRHGLGFRALDDAVEALGALPIDDRIATLLRRPPGHAISRPPITVASSPPTSGDAAGAPLGSSHISKAEAKRLAAAYRTNDTAPPALDAAFVPLLERYEPAGISSGRWEVIKAPHSEVLARAQLKGVQSFTKHLGVVAAYLNWRVEHRLPLDLKAAWTFAEIERYCATALVAVAPRSLNDYRSRLRNIASKANPGLSAPPRAKITAGHIAARPGYQRQEELRIRAAALNQRRPKIRRKLCDVVGFAAGGGLDAADLRHLRRRDIDDRGADGIHVDIPGPRPRRTVIRRDYEELVRIGLEGLRPADLVLGNDPKRQNVAASVIDQAELFDDIPKVSTSRLRATWLGHLMTERVPLQVILTTAGLKSARTLIELLPNLPEPVLPDDLLRGDQQ